MGFQSGIRNQLINHNKAQWSKKVEIHLRGAKKQQNITATTDKTTTQGEILEGTQAR